ncbi:hypothetical protein ACH4TQ_27390 [Streptomyces sp. NPDC021218]|uniref:hypothetical protein n=1 Tax=Streptomyces sp. NPDC021218 TaxID=3365119 RepID=UPI00378EE74F
MPELTDAQLDQLMVDLGLTQPARRRGHRPLAPCGTVSAYQRHVRKGEPIDDACRTANTEAKRKQTGVGKALEAITNHGTTGGYKRHLYRGEKACADCLRAEREYSQRTHEIRRSRARRKGGIA